MSVAPAAPTFAWSFPTLEVSPQTAGKTNVVVTVHWKLSATDAYRNTVSQGGQLTIPFDPAAPFTPFTQLTSQIVQGWVGSILNVPTLEAALSDQLALMAPPPALVPMSPPWGA